MHKNMSDYEKKKVELELKSFTSTHFERPSACRNLDQIRYYVSELCKLIESYEGRFNYVPPDAYLLLAQYNARQNTMLYKDFVNSY
jgi:hypothetical protein